LRRFFFPSSSSSPSAAGRFPSFSPDGDKAVVAREEGVGVASLLLVLNS
jgi:hypothetical protein